MQTTKGRYWDQNRIEKTPKQILPKIVRMVARERRMARTALRSDLVITGKPHHIQSKFTQFGQRDSGSRHVLISLRDHTRQISIKRHQLGPPGFGL